MDFFLDSNALVKMEEYRRYVRLHAIVTDIGSNSGQRNQEWFADHNQLVCQYQQAFGNYRTIHDDIEDPVFRNACDELEVLSNKLMKDYNSYHWFSLADYLAFNKILIWVVDYVHEEFEDDELCSMFSNVTV